MGSFDIGIHLKCVFVKNNRLSPLALHLWHSIKENSLSFLFIKTLITMLFLEPSRFSTSTHNKALSDIVRAVSVLSQVSYL